ncbi:MAG: hypothetical protein ISS33_01450 [Candidatus Omnitrophica bacterium]|nr:hypothetical protein [Candidatus Omnitrophota bacterium]
MSIIGEALKKTQNTRTPEIKTTDKLKPLFPKNISLKKPLGLKKFKTEWKRSVYIRKSMITASWILAAIIGLVVLKAVTNISEKPTSPKTPIQKTPVSKAQPEPILQIAQVPDLTGIMFSPTKPYAIINETIVHEGTNITGFLVVKIFPDCVILSKNNAEFTLPLK